MKQASTQKDRGGLAAAVTTSVRASVEALKQRRGCEGAVEGVAQCSDWGPPVPPEQVTQGLSSEYYDYPFRYPVGENAKDKKVHI